MSEALKLYELTPSPNCQKVRIALNIKGLPFERASVNPAKREPLMKLSGQPLTPVLQHGTRVVYDSGAIVRYLDANFRDSTPLFSTSYQVFRKIEAWERFTYGELSDAVGEVFSQFFSGTARTEVFESARRMAHSATAHIESALDEGPFLLGEEVSAADVFCAPWVIYMLQSDVVASRGPVGVFFKEHLTLGEGRELTRDWAERMLRYDP